MIIGVPKEVKKHENRVGLLPNGVENLVKSGHTVLIENNAGANSGFTNEEYALYGAKILDTAAEVWNQAEMIIKVKEPIAEEYPFLRKGLLLFTYLHLASSKELTQAMVESGCVGIAYETIQEIDGSLPLLTPMSEVAGRMSVQIGARYLQKETGGRGVLLGGVPGVEPGTVMILGGGVVGMNAAQMAAGLGAHVYVLDVNLDRMRYLSETLPANVTPLMSTKHNIRRIAKEADLVVCGVLLPGAKAPKLITRDILKTMKDGSVIVDVAIDQGGGLETSRPTDHEHPTYIEEGVIHYCVTNMPGAVPVTSTIGLTNATWRYVKQIANDGFCKSIENPAIGLGVNVVDGQVTCEGVAEAFGLPYVPLNQALENVGLCQC